MLEGEKISWSISKSDRQIPWAYLGAAGFMFFLVAAYFAFSNNLFGTALFVVVPLVLVVAATQGPPEYVCEITNGKIKMNNKEYPIEKIDYFSIIDDNLVIKPKKQRDHVYIPVYLDDIDEIRSTLLIALEEREHEEDIGDIINRILRIH